MKFLHYFLKKYYLKQQQELAPKFKPSENCIGMELLPKFSKIPDCIFTIHLNGEIGIENKRYSPYFWKIIIKNNELNKYFPYISKLEKKHLILQFKLCDIYLSVTKKLQKL